MKWILSVVLAMLVTLFCVDFAPVHKSVVYAQSTPTGVSASIGEDESGDVSDQKSKKIVACDNFGFVWTLSIKGTKVTGNVETGDCGVYKVTGTYKKKKITLNAKYQGSDTGCCSAFTYTGTFNKKKGSGSGSWTNACDLSGTWSMSKCN
jgi:hypothetical protein